MNRVCTLMYHDVVAGEDFAASGLRLPGSDRYKLTVSAFDAHLDSFEGNPRSVHEDSTRLLTFDDGGASAASVIAPKLDAREWIGHFFVTTDFIGEEGFLTSDEIVALHAKGHVIGSHSCSHPERISSLSDEAMDREWKQSIQRLSEILESPVDTASVPGGFTSDAVVRAAARHGIRHLFTSEPTTKVRQVDDCRVYGRFAVLQDTPAATAAALLAGKAGAVFQQRAAWFLKKWAKRLGGRYYLRLRNRMVGN